MIPYHEDAQPLLCYNDDKFASCLAYGMIFVVAGIPFLLYLTSAILNWGEYFMELANLILLVADIIREHPRCGYLVSFEYLGFLCLD